MKPLEYTEFGCRWNLLNKSFSFGKESENTKEFGKKVCKYFIDTFQNGVHIGMEIWDSIERGILNGRQQVWILLHYLKIHILDK